MSSTSSAAAPPNWWYGVALFPVSAFFGILPVLALVGIPRLVGAENPASYLISITIFVLAQWAGIVLALAVLVALVLDIHGLRKTPEAWHPHWVWVSAGVVNLVAAFYYPVFAVSVLLLSFYLYRRGKQVGVPSF
ncbi:hypothetical protein [Haloferax larsenii]|uniref:Uncharacterized protein n=1 Tax=Haloferax larsenii TaxID=302484 RepID=A0A1H7LAU3_HALLR|nr:hypothetical protein [Haloferax larsenii]SEK95625.1 hypothetical protein SAMN04488691_102256 [Haloferax larsenii]